MTKINPKNENETKSDIFLRDINEPKNENETKTDIFLREIFKLDSYQNKLKYFNYFQNQNFSNL